MSLGHLTAMIIANGEACETKLLQCLAEQATFTLVLDGAMSRAVQEPIRIHALLGDFDRNFNPDFFRKTDQELEVIHAPDQNKTDLEKGIEYLITKGYQKIIVLWASGRRADHHLNNISTMVKYKHLVEIEMRDDYSHIMNVPQQFKKKYPAQSPISLMPISVVKGLTTKGLKYNLHNAVLQLGQTTSSSNEVGEEGEVEIDYESGDLILMECYDKQETPILLF